MTFGTLKKATAALLAALTFASIAVPAEAQYYGPPRHHPGPRPGPHHYGPPPPPPPPGYYRRHRDNAAGVAAAAGIIGLAAGAAIASQSRNCWTERQKVYLDDGRRVWRNVRVCR
jgi:hypothetical protein